MNNEYWKIDKKVYKNSGALVVRHRSKNNNQGEQEKSYTKSKK